MTQETTNDNDSQEQAPKTFSEDYVKELRQESASYRVKLREAESQLESLETARSELREKELLLAAKAAGAVDPQTLLKLVDKDSEGSPDEIIQQLLTEKPFLKGGSIGKPSNPVGGNGQPRIFTKAELDAMSHSEVRENWTEIQSQMSRGLIR